MANLTISPTVVKVLQIIKLNVPVTPSAINSHVGDGDYASKHVWYLRKLGLVAVVQLQAVGLELKQGLTTRDDRQRDSRALSQACAYPSTDCASAINTNLRKGHWR